MRFGAIYIVYEDTEYLEISLEGTVGLSKILVMVNDRPWYGNPSENTFWMNEVAVICAKYGATLVKTSFPDEVQQRNYGLDILQAEGIDYAFIIDGDEIYHKQEFARIQEFISANLRYSAFHIEWDTYWSKKYYVIRPRENYRPVIAVKTSEFLFTRIRDGTTSVIRSNSKVIPVNSNHYNGILIPPAIASCHHLSYARSDAFIKKKLETSPHHPEFIPDWYEKTWLGWKLGNTNLHPVTPSQYQTAVKSNFLKMPEQLRRFIKKERMMNHGCTIIIPNWNSKVLLEKCLDLVNKRTSGVKFEVIVVDNGSDKDDSVNYLTQLYENQPFKYHLKIVLEPKNLGFAGGINAGIRLADPNTDICLLNVDAEPQAGWLTALYETLIDNPSAGLVGPLGNKVPSGHQMEGQFKEDISVLNLHFFCVLISRNLIDKIGLLDPRYFPGGYDDNDYGSRARFAGFMPYISANSLVIHEPHQVFALNGLDYYKDADGASLFKFAEKLHIILHALSRAKDFYEDEHFAQESGLYIP